LDRQFNFTKASLEALPIPQNGRRIYYRDRKTRGLTFVLTCQGTRSFVFYRKIDGRPERIVLGRFEELTIEQARNKAAQLNAAIAEGKNPANARRLTREEMTLGELFEDYFERYSKPNKRFWHTDRSKFDQYLACGDRGGIKLSDRKLSRITRADIAQLHSIISKKHPVTANRVLGMISSIFSWAIRAGLWDKPNPALGISKNREKSRDRFLQSDELPRFFKALAQEENETLRDYLLISLLTGARQNNVLMMQWNQLNLDAGTWYIPETKNGTPQIVPLTPQALAILRSRKDVAPMLSTFVFEGKGKTGHLTVPKRGWYRILDRACIINLRIHDLRRTLGSWQAATGASLPIIGKTLNHKHPSSTAIYARLSIDPVRRAMETASNAMFSLGPPDHRSTAVLEQETK
jgi:integrase